MKDFKNFLISYKGAIIGGLIAIILVFSGLYKLILGAFVMLAGVYIGNYVQQNKDEVKHKIKDFIDKW